MGTKVALRSERCVRVPPAPTTATDTALLPAGKSKSFLLNLVAVYYRCAMVIVHGYIQQGSDQPVSAYQDSSKELLALVVDAYGEAVCFWPTTLLNASLLATMVLLPDGTYPKGYANVRFISARLPHP